MLCAVTAFMASCSDSPQAREELKEARRQLLACERRLAETESAAHAEREGVRADLDDEREDDQQHNALLGRWEHAQNARKYRLLVAQRIGTSSNLEFVLEDYNWRQWISSAVPRRCVRSEVGERRIMLGDFQSVGVSEWRATAHEVRSMSGCRLHFEGRPARVSLNGAELTVVEIGGRERTTIYTRVPDGAERTPNAMATNDDSPE